ncbi:MAG: ABC transporter substrate-binding protein [Clostridiales bacterium]|nr:ABC transporter substrate-binding protein [Clostridiales bacterium]
MARIITRRDFLRGSAAAFASTMFVGGVSVGAAEEGATEMTVGLSSAVTNLAPWEVGEPFYYTILNNVYLPLGILIDGELQPVMMTDWSTEDGLTYTITIYDGIFDTAGNAFTASDAVFSFLSSKNNAAKYAQYIETAEVIDDTTLTVTLTSDGLGVWEGVINYTFMVTQAAYEASSDGMSADPIGTGAYKMTNFVSGSTFTVEKADDFWQTDLSLLPDCYVPRMDKVTYDIITETTQMDIALRHGTIQAGYKVNASLIGDLEEVEGLSINKADAGLIYYLGYNMTENSVLSTNTALRQAISYAIDEEAVCQAVTSGLGSVNYAMQSPSKPLYNEEWYSWDYYQYDVEKAAEKLEEAGYSAGELTLSAICNGSNPVYSTALEIVQANLSAIGINMTISPYDASTFNVYRDASAGEYDMVILSTDATDYPGTTLAQHLDRNRYTSGTTLFGLSDDTLQEMLETLMTTEGNTQENANTVQEYLKDNAYVYSLYLNYSFCVYDSSLTEPEIVQTWIAATAVSAN